MKNILSLLSAVLIINACGTVNSAIEPTTNEIEVIKFMYLYEYPIEIHEKSFWANKKDEHASFHIYFEEHNFLNEIKTLPNHSCDKFDFYTYAFIIKENGKKNDTVYADKSLQTWFFKINGKDECRYDEKGIYTQSLRQQYSFFNDCW